MSSLINLINQVLDAGDTLQAATTKLIAQAKTMSYPDYVKACAAVVSRRYNIKPHASRKGGLPTFAKDTAPEQRLTALRKLHAGYSSKPSNKREPVAVNRKVVASIVASLEGMTRAEFNAVLAAVREAVSFE